MIQTKRILMVLAFAAGVTAGPLVQAERSVTGDALSGALKGAVIGGIAGDAGKGATAGAVGGALFGGMTPEPGRGTSASGDLVRGERRYRWRHRR